MSELVVTGMQLLYKEAAYLDERRWDDWLALYAKDCVYWLPTWLTEETLATNPQRELAHMYYESRAGLEDRILRIRTRKSPASNPMRRTTHLVGNIIADSEADGGLRLNSSWTCHAFDPLHKRTSVLFGRAEYLLRRSGEAWEIARKKTIVQNDYLPSMVDIYCI